MAIKLSFDSSNNVIPPKIILATKSGNRLGTIPHDNLLMRDCLNDYSEMSFSVSKFDNGKEYWLWDNLKNFKLAYCEEWDCWFEMTVEISDSDDLVKNIMLKTLGAAELSQINLDSVEINTEDDIARDDYIPTILHNPLQPGGSLIHRMLEKAPHYRIKHVDESIANIQRTFSFDGISIYDGFKEVGTELNCIFIFEATSDENGKIDRTVSVYDLFANCNDCGNRDDFVFRCPKCSSTNISHGYGEDTSIFVSKENLADEIQLSTNVDGVKNCFRLVAGDDLMTATIRNCNPNGTGYIWYFSDDMKEDMSTGLASKLSEYDLEYDYYYNNHVLNLSSSILTSYNDLVEKYKKFSEELEKVPESIKGYHSLMSAYYHTIDFELYLRSGLMPSPKLMDTDAEKEAAKLTAENFPIVAVTNLEICSSSTASSAALAMAKTIVDQRYRVKVNQGVLEDNIWTGNFLITNYSDEEDTATSSMISIEVTDEYEEFVRQKIDKMLSKSKDEVTDIVSLFKLEDSAFVEEIKKYCLNRLISFQDACQSCLDVLMEQGIADRTYWKGSTPNLYDNLYSPYYNKLKYIQNEISVRENELYIIAGKYDAENELLSDGLQNILERERAKIQKALNFENFLGSDLLVEFLSFRRDDTYQNQNYISDGLDNTKLFNNALEFIEVAKKEIYKSATMQHTITSTLKNLLLMKEFAQIVNNFKVGNWIRFKVDDTIYRLRLTEYTLDFSNQQSLSVTFSDVVTTMDGISDVESVLKQASMMATSYDAVTRQASQGKQSRDVINLWEQDGISLSVTPIKNANGEDGSVANSHGFLFRRYDSIDDVYDPHQLKLGYSSLTLTDDNWETVKTAIGRISYRDPLTGDIISGYGVNTDVLIGKLILGETLGIYNSAGTLAFDDKYGFQVRNENVVFSVNPNNETIFEITNGDEDILSVTGIGDLNITGNITAKSLILADGVTINQGNITGLSVVAVSGNYGDLNNIPSFATVATSGAYSDLSGTPSLAKVALSGNYSDLTGTPSLATVALSGSYNDLNDLPDLSGLNVIATHTTKIEELEKKLEEIEKNL